MGANVINAGFTIAASDLKPDLSGIVQKAVQDVVNAARSEGYRDGLRDGKAAGNAKAASIYSEGAEALDKQREEMIAFYTKDKADALKSLRGKHEVTIASLRAKREADLREHQRHLDIAKAESFKAGYEKAKAEAASTINAYNNGLTDGRNDLLGTMTVIAKNRRNAFRNDEPSKLFWDAVSAFIHEFPRKP